MAQGELWTALVSAIDPLNTKAMPVVLQSTIDLLEAELVKAKAALKQIESAQPSSMPLAIENEAAASAMAAYKHNLVRWASGSMSPGSCEQAPSATLLDILSNSLILDHLSPYLTIHSLLSLASTCTTFRSIIMDTPYVFRHLDLSQCRGALVPSMAPIDSGGEIWRSERMDESLTEDEFYSGPLRGIFSDLGRRSILQDVRTLILDGLSVPADLIADIILTDSFNVNILSIRGCLNLNERKLMQTLQYAVRPTRAKGMPRVKGIYHFTPKDSPRTTSHGKQSMYHHSSLGRWERSGTRQKEMRSGRTISSTEEENAGLEERDSNHPYRHPWYRPAGKVLRNTIANGWAQTLQVCEGIISFDAVLCRSPRHDANMYASANSDTPSPPGSYLGPAIATTALGPAGCEGCHTSPEGPVVWNESHDKNFPLLAPPPLHSSRISAAKSPVVYPNEKPALMMQCEECLFGRWCHRCDRWWCFNCLPHPEKARQHRTLHQTASISQRVEEGRGKEPKHFAVSMGDEDISNQVSAEIAGNVAQPVAIARQKSNAYARHALESTVSNITQAVQQLSAIGATPADDANG